MHIKQIVFESFDYLDRITIKSYLKSTAKIYVLEPFVAYHKKNGIFDAFPKPFPDYVDRLLQQGRVEILPAASIDAKTIYFQAINRAVKVVESVFPEYRRWHKELFEYVAETLKSSESENVFKKNLCNRLAEFYSVNILLHRIKQQWGPDQILVCPDTNVRSYLGIRSLLSRSGQDFFEHPNIRFPIQRHVTAFLESMKEYSSAMAKLIVQTVASIRPSPPSRRKRNYSYGITIVAPYRQLANNRRGPNFIVDNNKIPAKDTVYLPIADLTADQEKRLAEIPGNVFYPPKGGRFFSHPAKWKKLFKLVLRNNTFRNSEEINGARIAFSSYFKWQKVMEEIDIKHFITHCDFGIDHIGRNLALNQAGVQTWYYTDSANLGCYWKNREGDSENNSIRHPFWTYLRYDHFVTWSEFVAQYYTAHPGSFKQTHVVGCLWSGHIKKIRGAKRSAKPLSGKNLQGLFVLTVFDSTYSRNGLASYTEGLAFAEHIMKLADAFDKIYIFLKEKKKREHHYNLDPHLGPQLIDLYKRMSEHQRISTCPDNADTSELISISDMVVSFPFTSTTFEALSVNKPAVWHDPFGYYKAEVFGRVKGVTTHSYEELKTTIKRNMKPGKYKNTIPKGSPLLDPYRDGKAIDRFRDLIIQG